MIVDSIAAGGAIPCVEPAVLSVQTQANAFRHGAPAVNELEILARIQ